MAAGMDIHWTDDDELLSQFVLHQLPASQENTLASHLNTCEKCRHAVIEETSIVAGAKRAGRAALKGRLRLRLSEREQRVAVSEIKNRTGYRIHWTQTVSIAAVVAIIIAVGVYNNWFISDSWNQSSPQEGMVQDRDQPRRQSAREEMQKSVPERLQENPQISGGSSEKDHVDNMRGKKLREAKGSEDKRLSDEQFATSVTAEPGRSERVDAATVEGSEAKNELRTSDEATGSSPQAFWVEGYVIPNASQKSLGILSATPRDQAAGVIKQEAEGRKDDHQLSKAAAGITTPTISLRQQPTSSLPPALQYGHGRRGAIQTFIENRNNAIQVTVYVDSPVTDSELRAANVEVIDNDSLILNLASQRIGLRLPSALQGQVGMKAKQIR